MFDITLLGALVLGGMSVIPQDKPTEPMSVRGGANAAIWLLQSPQVRNELALSDEQCTRIDRMYHDFQRSVRGIVGTRTLSPEELEKRRTKMIDRERARTTEYSLKATRLLQDEQNTRLDQIFVQYLGEFALLNPEVADRLELTDGQKKQLVELADERNAKIEQMGGATEKTLAHYRAAMQAVLTDSQKEVWKKTVGKKFAIPNPTIREIH